MYVCNALYHMVPRLQGVNSTKKRGYQNFKELMALDHCLLSCAIVVISSIGISSHIWKIREPVGHVLLPLLQMCDMKTRLRRRPLGSFWERSLRLVMITVFTKIVYSTYLVTTKSNTSRWWVAVEVSTKSSLLMWERQWNSKRYTLS